MPAAQQAFHSQVQLFRLAIDEDTLQYIDGILEDLNDLESVREATEQFVQEAADDPSVVDQFYATLKLDSGQPAGESIAKPTAQPTPIKAEQTEFQKPIRIESASKALDSLSLDSSNRADAKVYCGRSSETNNKA